MGLFGRKKKAVEALKKILSPAYRVKVGIEASKTWKALEYFYQSEAIQDLPYAPLFGPNLEELVRLKDENPEAWEEVWKPFVKEGGKIYELLGVGYIDGKLVKQEVEKGLEIMLDYWNDIKDEWWTHFKKPGDFWRNRIEWIMEGYKKWIKKNGEKYVNKVNNVQWLPVGEEVYAEIEGLPVIYCPMEERVRESTCMALAHAIASVDENARRGLERALESWRPTFKRPLEGDVALHYVYLHSEPFVSLAFYKVPKDYEKPLRLNEVIDLSLIHI